MTQVELYCNPPYNQPTMKRPISYDVFCGCPIECSKWNKLTSVNICHLLQSPMIGIREMLCQMLPIQSCVQSIMDVIGWILLSSSYRSSLPLWTETCYKYPPYYPGFYSAHKPQYPGSHELRGQTRPCLSLFNSLIIECSKLARC